jgi:hypothetical protein
MKRAPWLLGQHFALGTAVVPDEHAAEVQQLPDVTPVLDIDN